MKKTITVILLLSCSFIGFAQNDADYVKNKVKEYAYFDLKTDLSKLSVKEKQLIPIFVQISEIMDQLFWKQTYGDVANLKSIKDPYMQDFVTINYGPWDRL